MTSERCLNNYNIVQNHAYHFFFLPFVILHLEPAVVSLGFDVISDWLHVTFNKTLLFLSSGFKHVEYFLFGAVLVSLRSVLSHMGEIFHKIMSRAIMVTYVFLKLSEGEDLFKTRH